ncbi:F-box/kelch-repeat protein At5g26960-like [Panicum virgatum]|uniref:F-box domain-containing protein n=1 Tax=Panicum virgatum TaxID=38727 RepID=A0A8T0U1J8_PANVG|nr:F-box/kelch-repeat protein At5g26960-like [Panicum virgatum]KAG2614734.1 hypothetical protein PVAP13_3NG005500 [Panicum virgatum]
MAAESCHPRGLSWLARSCIPADPARHIAVPVPIAASSATNPASDAEESPISALPDELLLECLARVPRASLPPLPAVCRRFAALLASHGFLHLRRAHGRLRPCLLAVSVSSAHGAAGTFARALLQLGPWSRRPELEVAALPLPPPLLHCAGSSSAFAHARAVALGREVFLIGRGAALRVDALTGAARACAPTLFPRKKFAAAAVGGRIYVAGGSARTAAVEEYDPSADAWRVVAEAPRRRYGCVGAAAGGVFYVAGGVAVSGHPGGDGGARALEAHACAGSVDALHVASGAWAWSARPRAVPGGGCVVGACGAGDGHLYVVASHAVDLSFWRWSGGGGGANRGGGGACGWVALEAPPVPRGSVGLGMAVRVAMAGVGGDRVAAVVNVAAAVRGHNAAGGGAALEGMVLVYDIGGGKWSRAPDLPRGFRRAACAAVEC